MRIASPSCPPYNMPCFHSALLLLVGLLPNSPSRRAGLLLRSAHTILCGYGRCIIPCEHRQPSISLLYLKFRLRTARRSAGPPPPECVLHAVQYWKMDQSTYEHGTPPYGPPLSPEFCLGHWQTQCRATFEAPMDPHVTLGGFPTDSGFRNYSADATAFVVTYPVDSSQDNRLEPTCPQAP